MGRVFLWHTGIIKPALALIMLLLGTVLAALAWQQHVLPAMAARGEQEALRQSLEHIFTARVGGLVDGDYHGLEDYYDTGRTSGLFAYHHEVGRIKYVQEWFRQRRVVLVDSRLDLRIIDAGCENGRGWASVSQHLILAYRHQGEPESSINHMGVRTLHWVELEQHAGGWRITRDWYWDPFETDDLEPDIAPGTALPQGPLQPPPPGRYRRQAAVAYADRYSGVRLGKGDGHYNQAYRDFTGLGGDCANFASQVLSDSSAGGIPRDWSWNYHNGEGSQAWAQAGALAHHLLDNGLAVCLKRGDFQDVTEATARFPGGAVNDLHPGDIIAYEEGGAIGHVSVVVGRDSAGYLLVNSHTADRARVPWDMGWDNNTVYWLLHIVY